MEQLKLRWASQNEAQTITEWLTANKANDYDPAITEYPTLKIMCSYGSMGPVMYLPSQRAIVLESIGPKPGIDAVTAAQALRDLVKGMTLDASGSGIREIYFIASTDDVKGMALKHGFELIESPVLRMKL